ncbi:uncharacterized protein LOC135472895 [Liolophura sinensis]|uniref:uncharacterized protein LOC135472895 n=1 Tax=Liolophura sinensis TaxID=3198878 RepID=UPI003158E9C4
MESAGTRGLENRESEQRPEQSQPFSSAPDLYHLNLHQDMVEKPGEQISIFMETAQSQPCSGERDFHHHGMKSKKSDNTESPRKRQRSKPSQDGCQTDSYRVKSDSSSPGRSGKQASKKSYQEGKSGSGRLGEGSRSDSAAMGLLSSPTPSHGSHEGSDISFKSSLLDEVLTEKKLALLKSPGVKAFLQQQQAQASANKMSSSKMC